MYVFVLSSLHPSISPFKVYNLSTYLTTWPIYVSMSPVFKPIHLFPCLVIYLSVNSLALEQYYACLIVCVHVCKPEAKFGDQTMFTTEGCERSHGIGHQVGLQSSILAEHIRHCTYSVNSCYTAYKSRSTEEPSVETVARIGNYFLPQIHFGSIHM
jgi:hypothetical protein